MGIRGYERAAQEYEHYLDNGGYRDECNEDCHNCDNTDCEYWKDYYEEEMDEMENENEN